MKRYRLATSLLAYGTAMLACASPQRGNAAATIPPSGADPEMTAFIGKILAVDNHSHPNSVAPDDADADALPLDGIAPFELPAPLHPDNPDWLAAYQALYQYPYADLSDAHLRAFRGTMQGMIKAKADTTPITRPCRTSSSDSSPARRVAWGWPSTSIPSRVPAASSRPLEPIRC